MVSARVSEELPGSADAVWALIQNFGDMSAWAPDAKLISIEGTGRGAVRVVDTQVGLFRERCEAHDEASRSFSYRLLESPMLYDDYVAIVTVSPIDDARCEIEWKSTFALREGSEDEAARVVEGVYRDGFIAALRQTIDQRGG